jgi:hypothetical protein
MKVAACAVPLKVTVDEVRNPVPLIVSVWVADPAGSEAGDKGGVITGLGLFTVKGSEFEGVLDAPGFVTDT